MKISALRTMINRWWLVVCLVMTCLPAASDAQSVADDFICRSGDTTPDERIAACTRLLALPTVPSEEQAALLVTRGDNWQKKGNVERASNDISRALELNPRYAPAYLV